MRFLAFPPGSSKYFTYCRFDIRRALRGATMLSLCSMTMVSQNASFAPTDPAAAGPAPTPQAAKTRIANRTAEQAASRQDFGKLPLSFEANRGQVDPQVRFTSRGNGYSLFLTDKEAVLTLSKREASKSVAKNAVKAGTLPRNAGATGDLKTDVVRMQLAGAAPGLKVTGEEQLPGVANYFIGNDPGKWHAGIPTYAKVKYAGVYPGVDLVYYGNQRQLEYDFVVARGADPKQVKLYFAGAEKLKLNADGDLTVVANNGEIAFRKPAVYQLKGDPQAGGSASERQPVEGKFTLLAKNTVGFELGAYDRSRAVVIDPTLVYSTYLGGSGLPPPYIPYIPTYPVGDQGAGIAVDASGNTYLTGSAASTNFPIKGAYQSKNNAASQSTTNVFVTKMNPSGSALIYSTYLGGSGTGGEGDAGYSIAIDASGHAYVTGSSYSSDFPVTKGAFQTVNDAAAAGAASNAFVTELDASGSSLIYSTYLGGSFRDNGDSIAVNASGNAYVTGVSASTDFPVTKGAFQKVNNAPQYDENGFVTELNPSGSSLVYSTYLGGSSSTSVYGIAVDAAGNAYLTGHTQAAGFPVTKGAFQTTSTESSGTGFVTKLNPTGSSLVYSTFLGGNTSNAGFGTQSNGIAVDGLGNAYVTGYTGCTDFPVTGNAFQKVNNGAGPNEITLSNAFVTKLNPSGSALVYSTYLGGKGAGSVGIGDSASAIAVDAFGNASITGAASSVDFPVTQDAFQAVNNSGGKAYNAFATRLNSFGSGLLYSTYLGGTGTTAEESLFGDSGSGIALDPSGDAYIVGTAVSTNFPVTEGAFQKVNNGATLGTSDGFVAKFGFPTLAASATSLTADSNPQKVGVAVTFTADVTPETGSGVPTGTVAFSIDGGAAIDVALDDTGHASYATASLLDGVHTVVASYSGDVDYAPSVSETLSETIYGTALSLAVAGGSNQSALVGTEYTYPLAVEVTNATGAKVSGVTVAFSGAGLAFSSPTAITGGNGEASVTATSTRAGALTATATVVGAANQASFSLEAFDTGNVINFSQGFANAGPSMQFNGSAGLDGSGLRLTAAKTFQAGSAFYAAPVNIQTFTSDFSFQLTDAVADGITFTIQNVGPTALGSYGGGLGYAGIGKSMCFKFDIHNNAGEGPESVGIFVDGAEPTTPSTEFTSGLLQSGVVLHVQFIYDGSNLSVALTEQGSNALLYGTSFPINIPAVVGGNAAYVGFTGGTGKETANQEILSWAFSSGPPNFPDGFSPSAPIMVYGNASIAGSAIQLTDDGRFQAGSAYYAAPLPVGNFSTDFTFNLGLPASDGITFAIQNLNQSGTNFSLVGDPGGALGYPYGFGSGGNGSLTMALKFDTHNNAGEGNNSTGLYVGDAAPTVPAVDLNGTGIDLGNGHNFHAHVAYAESSGIMTLTLTDTVTSATWTHSFPSFDLIKAVDSNGAFMGFTGGTGALVSTQQILNWIYTSQ